MQPPPFAPLRYDDDDLTASPAGVSGALKMIPTGDGITTSLGGEVRQRLEHYSGENFGLAPPTNDGYDLSRATVFADVHLPRGRLFVEIGSHFAPGKAKYLPPDQDSLDLHQAFVDVPLAGATLRLGRQEMMIGSGRFVDVREGPNIRQTYDGVRLTSALGKGRLDLFSLRPTEDRTGAFDDRPDPHQQFDGAYLSLPVAGPPLSPDFGVGPPPTLAVDGYAFRLRTTPSALHPLPGTDDRGVGGLRLWGAGRGWDYDVEGMGQFGRSAARPIEAGGVSGKIGYSLSSPPLKPRFGLQADWFSGDRGRGRGVDGTNDPLFSRGAYFSEPGLQTFSNIIDAYPSVTLNPLPVLAVQTGVNFVWRQTTRDAVYITPGAPIPGTAGVGGRYTGTNGVLQATWQAHPDVTVAGSVVKVWTSSRLQASGARDVTYTAAWVTFEF